MSTSWESLVGVAGKRKITRCDRCNGASGWGVITHAVVNQTNLSISDYCNHCLIIMAGFDCGMEYCIHLDCIDRMDDEE